MRFPGVVRPKRLRVTGQCFVQLSLKPAFVLKFRFVFWGSNGFASDENPTAPHRMTYRRMDTNLIASASRRAIEIISSLRGGLLWLSLSIVVSGLISGCSETVQLQQDTDGTVLLSMEKLEEPVSLNPYLSFLLDAPADCDIMTVYEDLQDQFQPWDSELVPSFGYTNNPVWMKLSMRSAEPEEASVLFEIVNAELDYVDLYLITKDPEFRGVRAAIGRFVPPGATKSFRRIPQNRIIFEPGQTIEIFVRIESSSSMWLPVQIKNRATSSIHSMRRLLLDQPVLWFAAFAAFLSLILAAILRDRLFLYNALFSFSYFVYHITGHGYAINFIAPTYEWILPHVLLVASLLSFVAILSFAHRYYQASLVQRPTLRRIARYLTWFTIAMLPVGLSLPSIPSQYLVDGMAFVSIAWISLLIFLFTHPPFRWSQLYFICAWVCFATTSLMIHLIRPGLIPTFVLPSVLEMATVIPIISLLFTATSDKMKEAQRRERELAEAREAESNARLAALRYQINPHFLFNTLASIDALSHVDPQKIPKLIERLADFLRPRLEPSDSQLIPLGLELKAVQAYLEIEQMRFGSALRLTLDASPIALTRAVPDGILQPLVENAIKHRPVDQEEINIRIRASLESGELHLSVVNRGCLNLDKPRPLNNRSGIGLENVRRRLHAHFGERGQVTLLQEEERVICRISAPSITADPGSDTSYSFEPPKPTRETYDESLSQTTIA